MQLHDLGLAKPQDYVCIPVDLPSESAAFAEKIVSCACGLPDCRACNLPSAQGQPLKNKLVRNTLWSCALHEGKIPSMQLSSIRYCMADSHVVSLYWRHERKDIPHIPTLYKTTTRQQDNSDETQETKRQDDQQHEQQRRTTTRATTTRAR